ncbi:hypothetical protein C8J57DRAFT_1259057 [Mycena rebaudengoi]|nr:hypothetical protein C8J57DRAFT_1259057 [Mycena rebaudengoi]
MCFRLTRPVFCPVCRSQVENVVNVFRCSRSPGPHALCGDWNLHYANASIPLGRPVIDLVDPLSEQPYNNINFFIRPCVNCAIQICTASRLIMFERFIRNNCTVFTDLSLIYADQSRLGRDYYTKPDAGYRRSDYPADARFTGSTAPIYMTAVLCSALTMPAAPISGPASGPAAIEAMVDRLFTSNYPLRFYDPLEFFEWSGEFSSGSFFSGAFDKIGADVPSFDRVDCRRYDRATRLWDHPFHGEWARKAVSAQQAPFCGREISRILRTFTINGLHCDRSLRFLAPDCFAPTGFVVKNLVMFARMHAVELRRMDMMEKDSAANADTEEQQMLAVDNELDALMRFRRVLLTRQTVYQTRLF